MTHELTSHHRSMEARVVRDMTLFSKGDRIRLLEMRDEFDPVPQGSTGMVRGVQNDHSGTLLLMTWDRPVQRTSQHVVIPPDRVEKIEDET